MPERIRVAIVGGSFAGCTLANGLLQYPHVEFDIFEAKATFRERGATVGLGVNAERALRAMGLDADQMFNDSGAILSRSTYCLVGHGEHRGKPILQLPGGGHSVDRTKWLDVLLRNLPVDRLHASKKFTDLTQSGSAGAAYMLHFHDGTTHEADVVIGCDGVHSKLREIILGPEHTDLVAPRFGGYWDARGRISQEKAVEYFGTGLFDPAAPDSVGLVGEGAFMLFGLSDRGAALGVIVSAAAGPEFDRTSWKTSLSRDFLQQSYHKWDDRFRNGAIESIMAADVGPGVVFSQWESPEAPNYYRGGLCMIGDSAHTMTPWMGQGAGMATEDVAVLAVLLGLVQSTKEIPAALAAFDQTRRGRPEYFVKQSQEVAKLLTGQFGLDPAEIARLGAAKWWDPVMNFDAEAHVKQAIDNFHRFKVT